MYHFSQPTGASLVASHVLRTAAGTLVHALRGALLVPPDTRRRWDLLNSAALHHQSPLLRLTTPSMRSFATRHLRKPKVKPLYTIYSHRSSVLLTASGEGRSVMEEMSTPITRRRRENSGADLENGKLDLTKSLRS
ncbi:hypothetical protein F2Q70_00012714 [Brassica cretica]|uniref:Uncharacterized protein n=1 Tax=Brassica cretica TaxID=69181 RepID=A0A8S9LXB2_BRACR|nr:hypothetical protein F2Q70_00012714 [Brassica cretica]